MRHTIHNLFILAMISLPAFAALWYHDYQERKLESNPIVSGVQIASIKPVRIAPMLPDQKTCIAINAYAEARGEGTKGMIAVTNVVLNRTKDSSYPSTPCEVIYQPKQFSWTNDGISPEITEEQVWQEALKIADHSVRGKLPNLVGPARYYYNPKKANPKWAKKMIEVKRIGDHRFMDKPEVVKPTKSKA